MTMAAEGQKKTKFNRTYVGYNPEKNKGPITLRVGSVITPTTPSP